MRLSRCFARALRALGWTPILALALATPCRAQDGLLGVFFDREATNCADQVGSSAMRTLYVVFLPRGSSSGGITGAEFRIDRSAAGSFLFQDESVIVPVPSPIKLGTALGAGANVAFTCQQGTGIPILSFQVFNPGAAGSDVDLRIAAKQPPSNRFFPCPAVTLCDEPAFTEVCVEAGKALLNPSGAHPCGSTREMTEWSKVKALYKK